MLKRIDWHREYPEYTARLKAMSVYVWYFRRHYNGDTWEFHPDFFLGLSLVPME
jgi:hypothetical protein